MFSLKSFLLTLGPAACVCHKMLHRSLHLLFGLLSTEFGSTVAVADQELSHEGYATHRKFQNAQNYITMLDTL